MGGRLGGRGEGEREVGRERRREVGRERRDGRRMSSENRMKWHM